MKTILYILLYLLVIVITWVGLLIINHLILVKLSLVQFKEFGGTEVEGYIGHSFDILAISSLIYILMFFSQFFFLKKYTWISYLSIGLWIITIIGIYVWNE